MLTPEELDRRIQKTVEAKVRIRVREALAKEIALLFRLCGLLTVLSLIATFFIGGGPLPQGETQPDQAEPGACSSRGGIGICAGEL